MYHKRKRRYTDHPDLGRHSASSRTGRKARRKLQDLHTVAERARLELPALAGPPIPNSHLTGRRRHYTLAQQALAQLRSWRVRHLKAKLTHDKTKRLWFAGHSQGAVGRLVGYSREYVNRIINHRVALRGPGAAPLGSGGGQYANITPWAGISRVLALKLLYLRESLRIEAADATRKAATTGVAILRSPGKAEDMVRRLEVGIAKYVMGLRRGIADDAAAAAKVRLTYAFVETMQATAVDAAVRQVNQLRFA